jgi:polar amino acid transport system substrate-binding protein
VKLATVVGALTVLAVVACGGGSTTGSGTSGNGIVQTIKSRGTVYVGFVNESPYDYVDDSGNLTGFEIDMIKHCAQTEGLPSVFGVQNNFDSLIPGLQAKRYDVITAGMSFNSSRAQVAQNTDPTYTIRIVAFVHKGNPMNIHSLDDIKSNSQVRVGAPAGTAQLDTLKSAVPANRVTSFLDFNQTWSALQANRIDAAVVPESTGASFLKANPGANIQAADPFTWPTVLKSVWWVRKSGESDLLNLLNDCIKKMKQDGTMASILGKYGLSPTNVLPVDAKPS